MKSIRLFSLFLLLLLMTAVLASCAPRDARALYDDAAKKTEALEQFHAKADMKMKLGISGISVELPLEIDLLADRSDAENTLIDCELEMSIPMIGTSVACSLYADNGYIYIDMLGEKRRTPLTASTGQQLPEETAAFEEAFSSMINEALAETEIIEEGRNKRISFSLPADRFTEEMQKLIALSTTETPEAADTEITAEAFEITLLIGESGCFERIEFNLELELSVNMAELDAPFSGSVPITLGISGSMDLVDIGKELTIEAPDDLDAYEEAEEIPSLSDAFDGIL